MWIISRMTAEKAGIMKKRTQSLLMIIFLITQKLILLKLIFKGYEPIALKGMSKIIRQPGRTVVFGELYHTVCKRPVQAGRIFAIFKKSWI